MAGIHDVFFIFFFFICARDRAVLSFVTEGKNGGEWDTNEVEEMEEVVAAAANGGE